VFRLLADAYITTRGDRLATGPRGRDGGSPGVTGAFKKRTRAGEIVVLNSKVNNEFFHQGECFIVETSGGGGIGNPVDRPAAAVIDDVRAARVTVDGARRDYRVVVSHGDVDTAATTALRGGA
ncbi:hydantoinase B/oxoprolinase family protein, partial [Streptomyces sp. NPDC058171]